MELPQLGKNCFEPSCKQLDFLPMKCDACANIFCRDHIHYNKHSCPESYKKDKQIPVCPLCNALISLQKDELPDVVVGRHIDSDCQSDTAKQRRKIFTNKCSFKSCKHKELIPVKCEKCQKNFCLKHRHEQDHNCNGFENSGQGMSRPGAAAIFRNKEQKVTPPSSASGSSRPKPQVTTLSSIGRDLDRQRRERDSRPSSQAPQSNPRAVQAGLSEDQALAQAIQMSLAESQQAQPQQPTKPLTQQEEEDLLLAQAIAASEQEAQRETRRRTMKVAG